jgi:hypothetical protein
LWAVVERRRNQQPFNVDALKSQRSAPMKRKKYMGIDVHQATSVVVMLDSDGKVVLETIVATEAAAMIRLLRAIDGPLHLTFETETVGVEMSTPLRLVWIVVLLAGALSATMFVAQGGFGGGHGKFDPVLILLGLPWSILPLPEVISEHDALRIVATPVLANAVLLGTLTAVLRKRTRG